MKKFLLVSLLILLLFSLTFSQTPEEILIYDGETDASNLSSFGFWIAPEGCKVEEVEGIAHSGKKSMKIYFVWSSWWAGMGINFPKWDFSKKEKIFDLSQFKNLEFYIKAEKSDNYSLNVTLVEAPEKEGEKEFYSEKFTASIGVPTSWTKITVPLKSFVTVDLKRICGITIEVTGIPSGEATLYVDDIKFVK